MTYNTLDFTCQDYVGWLRLNRPKSLNAISPEMVKELRHFFTTLDEHPEARVVIVAGTGRAFCAGFDVKGLTSLVGGGPGDAAAPSGQATNGLMLQRAVADIVVQMRRAPQPLIAAVRGPAAGGGFSLTMACDIRIAGESARFNANNIRIGYSAGDMGSSYFLPRLIGLSRAAEYMYTGRVMDAASAERIGYVSRVVPDDQLEQVAGDLATEMLSATPFALRLTKELLNSNMDAPNLDAATQLEGRGNVLCGFTEDAQEATKAAFFEKRRPVYHDK